MPRRLILVLGAVISCGGAGNDAPLRNVAPPPSNASLPLAKANVDGGDAAPPASAATHPSATFPFAAGSDASLPPFHVVLSGRYEQARILPLTGAAYVAWTADEQTTLARVDGADLVDLSPAPEIFVGLYGRYPDHLYMQTRTPTRAYQVMNLARWTAGKWKPLQTEVDFVDVGPSGSGWLTLVDRGDPFDPELGARWMDKQDATPPDVLRPRTEYTQLKVFPNGDAVGVGIEQSDDIQSHTFLALEAVIDGKRLTHPLPAGVHETEITLVAPSSHDAYALLGDGETLLHFDGHEWSAAVLDPAATPLLGARLGPHGDVLLIAKRALWLRGADGAFAPLAQADADFDTPQGEVDPTVRVDGIERGSPWAVAGGQLLKLVGGAWTSVPLPSLSDDWTPLAPTGVTVVSPTDVWVTATASHGSGATGEELKFLLHTQAPTKELRAGAMWKQRQEPTYGGHITVWREWGAREWPPIATDDCPAPEIVFAHRAAHAASGGATGAAAFARARKTAGAALRSGSGSASAKLAERASGQETLLVARPGSMREAREIVKRYSAHADAGATAEILCPVSNAARPAK